MPLINVHLPQNVIYLFKYIIPIALFDWLGFDFTRSKWFAKLFFNFDFETQSKFDDRVLSPQASEFGFDSHNFILIMGSFFTLWVAYLTRMTYLALFKQYIHWARDKNISEHRFKQMKKWHIQKSNRIFYSNFILLMLMSYYEILIGGFLNLQISLTEGSGERLASFFTVMFLIMALLVVPRMTYFILSRDIDYFQRDSKTQLAYTHKYYWFQRKLRMFWWRQPTQTKMQLAYSLFFLLRRLVFVYLIFMHGSGT